MTCDFQYVCGTTRTLSNSTKSALKSKNTTLPQFYHPSSVCSEVLISYNCFLRKKEWCDHVDHYHYHDHINSQLLVNWKQDRRSLTPVNINSHLVSRASKLWYISWKMPRYNRVTHRFNICFISQKIGYLFQTLYI